jgi:hypothetical protein
MCYSCPQTPPNGVASAVIALIYGADRSITSSIARVCAISVIYLTTLRLNVKRMQGMEKCVRDVRVSRLLFT